MYQHTYTHRHTDMGTGLSDCSASLEVAEVRVLCTAHQKERDFPLQSAPAQNGLCIHDVILQCVTAHLEDVSA